MLYGMNYVLYCMYVQHKTIMTIYIIIIKLYYFSGHLFHGKTNCMQLTVTIIKRWPTNTGSNTCMLYGDFGAQ